MTNKVITAFVNKKVVPLREDTTVLHRHGSGETSHGVICVLTVILKVFEFVSTVKNFLITILTRFLIFQDEIKEYFLLKFWER